MTEHCIECNTFTNITIHVHYSLRLEKGQEASNSFAYRNTVEH